MKLGWVLLICHYLKFAIIKKRVLLKFFILFISTIYLNADFLSTVEYGAFLYKNPRGISCANCHNADGSGKTIIKYHHKNKIKIIKSKNIQKISLQKLKNSLKKKKGIMPEYNLTNSEIVALYKFLNTP